MTGFVYFLRCGDFVKVGYSSRPKARLASLLTATPHDAVLLATFRGTTGDERTVHRLLHAVHHRREWFRFGPEVEAIIKEGIPHSDLLRTTVSDIINLWPSPADFAVDLGLASAMHARAMRLRGSIPRWYWSKVETAAIERGLDVTAVDLEMAHRGKRQFGTAPQPLSAA